MKQFLRKARVAVTPNQWLLKTKLSNGALVYGRNKPGFGGRGIYIYREDIEKEFFHLEKFLTPGGTFVDIGANTGIYSIKAAKHYDNHGGKVLAIEPFTEVMTVLAKNVRANKFKNVKLYNFCASDKTSTATFFKNFNKPNSFSLIKREEAAEELSTLTVALDDLYSWEKMEGLDYIKIDVEGVEDKVLKGAQEVIKKFRPIIQLELSVNDIPISLENYAVFRAPGSPNKVCIPKEHAKFKVPESLGWQQIS